MPIITACRHILIDSRSWNKSTAFLHTLGVYFYLPLSRTLSRTYKKSSISRFWRQSTIITISIATITETVSGFVPRNFCIIRISSWKGTLSFVRWLHIRGLLVTVSCSGTVCLSTGTTCGRALASPDDLSPRKCLPVCSAFVLKQLLRNHEIYEGT